MMMRVCGQCCILGPILQYQGADGCNCHMAVFMVRSLHQDITSAGTEKLDRLLLIAASIACTVHQMAPFVGELKSDKHQVTQHS